MKHIRITTHDSAAWCNVTITDSEPTYRDAEAAALQGTYNIDQLPNTCGACIDAIVHSLQSTRGIHHDESYTN
jgi:hypothetical protein